MRRWVPIWACLWAGCVADPAEVVLERQQLELHATNAQMYLEAGDLSRARQQAEKALEIDDHYHKAKLILGNVLFLGAQRTTDPDRSRELLDEAEERLLEVAEDASKSDVSVFKAYYVLGDLYHFKHAATLRESVRLQKAGGAQADYEAIAAEADVFLDLAVRYYQNALLTSRERFDAARARLVETLFYRGRKHPEGPDYDSALEQAALYIDKATTDQQVLRERLQAIPKETNLSDQERTLALQRTEDRIKELHYNVVRMREQRARLLARRKDWDAAAAELERAITEEPDYSLLYHAHGLALAQAGSLARAHAQLSRFAAMRMAAREELVADRDRLAGAPGVRDEQIRKLDEAINACHTDRRRVALCLAVLDCRLGRTIEARQQLDALLVDNPESEAALLLGVANAMETRDLARARTLVKAFIEALPKDLRDVRALAEGLADEINGA